LDRAYSATRKIAAGAVSARAAYEISRVPQDDARRALAAEAARGALTHEDAARIVRQRKGKSSRVDKGTTQTFLTENGWRIVAKTQRKAVTYYEIEAALLEALDEVRTRIKNKVGLY
jgi:hypothetical protein